MGCQSWIGEAVVCNFGERKRMRSELLGWCFAEEEEEWEEGMNLGREAGTYSKKFPMMNGLPRMINLPIYPMISRTRRQNMQPSMLHVL